MKVFAIRPPPNKCDECGSKKIFCIDRVKLYGISQDIRLNDRKIWRCKDCRASVLCHVGTNSPLGPMANAEVRKLRKEIHDLIDPVWKSKVIRRNEIYNWIARNLDKSVVDFHITDLNEKELRQAICLCKTIWTRTVQTELKYGQTPDGTLSKRDIAGYKRRRRSADYRRRRK